MLFQEYTVTDHSSVVEHIGDFADALGWTVTPHDIMEGYTAGIDLVAPTSAYQPSPLTWHLGAYDPVIGPAGLLAYHGDYVLNVFPDEGSVVKLNAPFDATMTLRISPTKVSIFGGTAPQPWIAAVLTYEYNLYRHLYMGHVEPIGGFTGGELLSGCQPRGPSGSPTFDFWNYMDAGHHYHFNARGKTSNDRLGGLHVVHANAAAEWNKFWSPTGFSRDDAHPSGTVCGGFLDGFNDGYAIRARNPYAGTVLLVPQNLYITDDANGFVPVGRVPGVRLVDMIDLAPEQSVDVGGVYFRVFPAWSRSTSETHDLRGSRQESSHYIGYAYEEEPD